MHYILIEKGLSLVESYIFTNSPNLEGTKKFDIAIVILYISFFVLFHLKWHLPSMSPLDVLL